MAASRLVEVDVLVLGGGPAGAAAARVLACAVTRHRYYSSERRWPDAPFWRGRSSEPVLRHRPTAVNIAST